MYLMHCLKILNLCCESRMKMKMTLPSGHLSNLQEHTEGKVEAEAALTIILALVNAAVPF